LELLNTYKSQLQVTIVLSLIHTLYNSLQHALNIPGLLYLHRLSPSKGHLRSSFLSFCIQVLTGWQLSHNSLNSRLVLLITSRHGQHKNTSPNSSIVPSRNYRTDCEENTASQLLNCGTSRISCGHYITTAVIYRAIT
jgi:hypothetical protein